jgi:endothelin-converting enzyme/putative endopeptidase
MPDIHDKRRALAASLRSGRRSLPRFVLASGRHRGVRVALLAGLSLGMLGGAAAKKLTAAPHVEQPQPASPVLELPPTNPLGIDASIIDRQARPCDDFYRYACGGWLDRTEIPADRPSWSRGFSEIHERNQKVLQKILEDASKNKSHGPGDIERKLGDFYAACMAEDRIEKTTPADLAELLKPIDAIKNLDDLARELGREHLGVANPLFHFSSQQDFKDASRVIGSLDQGGLGLPDRDYYLKTDPKSEELRKDYLRHVEKMLTLAGAPAAKAKAQAQTIFAIEKQLATASMTRTERRDPKALYHRIELDGVLKLAPSFPWKLYLSTLGFPDVHEINVATPAFFSALDKLVKEQPLDNIKVYLRWHAINGVARQLSKPFVDESFRFFSQRLTGTSQILPRWKRCVSATDHSLGEALATLFVKQTFGEGGKTQAQEIISFVEGAMEENVKNLPWMDDATRAAALGKLKRIANKIGYPDKARDYSSVAISADSHLKNYIAASAFETRRDLAKIGKPLDRSEWLMTAPTVNAYYEPSMNEIVFPAGILQPPMFGRGVPRAVNFGAIGTVMGHEVTHGFDDEGRQFDALGNLKDWWAPKVSAEFDRRASCVVDQYSGYSPVEGLHLDGKLTLGENIADLGGLKLSFLAYRAAMKKSPTPPPSGSEFSEDQLFYLGFAQSWCDKRRAEYSRMLVTIDPHSPPEFRVNGPLSNLPEFAAAWKCKAGDKMVRQNLCAVW